MPLRLLLAALLVASSFGTGSLAIRRERSDLKAGCIAARAAVLRPPASRAVPDLPPLSPALPSGGLDLPTPPIGAAPGLLPAAGIASARRGLRAPAARAPPLPA